MVGFFSAVVGTLANSVGLVPQNNHAQVTQQTTPQNAAQVAGAIAKSADRQTARAVPDAKRALDPKRVESPLAKGKSNASQRQQPEAETSSPSSSESSDEHSIDVVA